MIATYTPVPANAKGTDREVNMIAVAVASLAVIVVALIVSVVAIIAITI